MLITVFRERFRYNSPELVDLCMKKYHMTFVSFTRILYNSGILENLPEEHQKDAFNLNNWELDGKSLKNSKLNLSVDIPK